MPVLKSLSFTAMPKSPNDPVHVRGLEAVRAGEWTISSRTRASRDLLWGRSSSTDKSAKPIQISFNSKAAYSSIRVMQFFLPQPRLRTSTTFC
jgi:hypothetical protein